MMPTVRNQQVYFKRLILSNVRSFGDEQRLEMVDSKGCPAQWTLILGDNGVGKTTLLQCLASMCPVPAVPADKMPKGGNLTAPAPTGVEPALLRRGDSELVALARFGEETVGLKSELAAGQSFADGHGKGVEIALEATIQVKAGELVDVKQTFTAMTHPVEPLVVGYGAARHMRYRGAEPFKLHPDTTASLFDPSLELADAKDILEQLDYARAKRQPGAKELLARIKEALATLLPDVTRASAIKLYGPATPGAASRKSGVQVATPYGEVPLEALSLGYQTMTAWTVDLAWRLYQRYPDAPAPMQEPAIVLIDELDLHLHPRWQRELRETISSVFPRVQFIATAHSPLLAQSYLDMNLAVVREENGQAVIENDPSVVKTWRIDEVVTSALYEVDSAFSPEIGRELQERTALMQKRRLTPAERSRLQELNSLAEQLTPQFDSESERALDVIRKAAQLFDADGQ
jgi:energy-coupling factor transporter ATP-binding protein EcfA2